MEATHTVTPHISCIGTQPTDIITYILCHLLKNYLQMKKKKKKSSKCLLVINEVKIK